MGARHRERLLLHHHLAGTRDRDRRDLGADRIRARARRRGHEHPRQTLTPPAGDEAGTSGGVAQGTEQEPSKLEVAGSNPAAPALQSTSPVSAGRRRYRR